MCSFECWRKKSLVEKSSKRHWSYTYETSEDKLGFRVWCEPTRRRRHRGWLSSSPLFCRCVKRVKNGENKIFFNDCQKGIKVKEYSTCACNVPAKNEHKSHKPELLLAVSFLCDVHRASHTIRSPTASASSLSQHNAVFSQPTHDECDTI